MTPRRPSIEISRGAFPTPQIQWVEEVSKHGRCGPGKHAMKRKTWEDNRAVHNDYVKKRALRTDPGRASEGRMYGYVGYIGYTQLK